MNILYKIFSIKLKNIKGYKIQFCAVQGFLVVPSGEGSTYPGSHFLSAVALTEVGDKPVTFNICLFPFITMIMFLIVLLYLLHYMVEIAAKSQSHLKVSRYILK